MNRQEAEDYIYQSYTKASVHHSYEDKDQDIRHPELTKDWIQAMAGTDCLLVTGSKGKGSAANMVSAIASAIVPTGLMTSPHLVSFNERFRVNGSAISDEDFVAVMEELKDDIDALALGLPDHVAISPMGIQTAMALTYFKEKGCKLNILECGKGAKYDDVNNAAHDYAIINGIFLEHTRELGSTLEEIAHDKSHVIQPGMKAVFTMEQEASVLTILEKRAKACQVPLFVYGRDFYADATAFTSHGMHFDVVVNDLRFADLEVPLLGTHMAKNCAMALAFCCHYFGENKLRDHYGNVQHNLASMHWPGRMDIVSRKPFLMVDACVNAGNVKPVLEVLHQMSIRKYVAIIGIPLDKDYLGVAKALYGKGVDLILTKTQNPYYRFSKEQLDVLAAEGIKATWADDLMEAVDMARQLGKPIVILGTTSLVGECEKNKPLL